MKMQTQQATYKARGPHHQLLEDIWCLLQGFTQYKLDKVYRECNTIADRLAHFRASLESNFQCSPLSSSPISSTTLFTKVWDQPPIWLSDDLSLGQW